MATVLVRIWTVDYHWLDGSLIEVNAHKAEGLRNKLIDLFSMVELTLR